MDVLNHNFIRLGLTCAKALQTATPLERDMRRRFAVGKLNGLTPGVGKMSVDLETKK